MAKKKNDYSFQLFARDAKDFADYPNNGERDALSLAFTALELNGAAGSVADYVGEALKKDKFGQQDRRLEPVRRTLIEASIGDLLFWAARVAHESGLTLEECASSWTSQRVLDAHNSVAFADCQASKQILERRRRRR